MYKEWSQFFVRFIRNKLKNVVHNIAQRAWWVTQCITHFFSLFLHEPKKNRDQFFITLLRKCRSSDYWVDDTLWDL